MMEDGRTTASASDKGARAEMDNARPDRRKWRIMRQLNQTDPAGLLIACQSRRVFLISTPNDVGCTLPIQRLSEKRHRNIMTVILYTYPSASRVWIDASAVIAVAAPQPNAPLSMTKVNIDVKSGHHLKIMKRDQLI